MIEYVPALISLVGGVLAFFFAKSGERNKVSGVGWVMAALLVGGGLLGLWVIHAKSEATEQANRLAAMKADEAAVANAREAALVKALTGGFDLKQTIPSLNLIFAQPFEEDGRVKTAEGFSGPLPNLDRDIVGQFDVSIGDSYYSASFRSEGPGRIALSGSEGGPVVVFGDQNLEIRGQTADDQESQWSGGPEPPSNVFDDSFAYSLTLPLDTQLRRVFHGIVAPDSLGSIQFRKGDLAEEELKRIEQGLNLNPPMLALYIPETDGNEQCDSYVHVPLRYVRRADPLTIDKVAYDVFELQLTPEGFTPDPCNNNPF